MHSSHSDALERATVIIIRFYICLHYHINRFLENWVLEQFQEKNRSAPEICFKSEMDQFQVFVFVFVFE